MEQIAQYSPEIDDALKAARKFFSNREAQLVYEAQWRAELDRRWFERCRNEARDAERDAKRDREHDAAMFNEMSNEKRDYIIDRLFRMWNVAPSEANAILKNKTDYRELNRISEKIVDCENYDDFLQLLQKSNKQATA